MSQQRKAARKARNVRETSAVPQIAAALNETIGKVEAVRAFILALARHVKELTTGPPSHRPDFPPDLAAILDAIGEQEKATVVRLTTSEEAAVKEVKP